jgi:hypothetical protein
MLLFGCERITRKKVLVREPAQNVKRETVTVEGLDTLFVNAVDPPRSNQESTQDQGWSLCQAAEAYNVTERTVRRWIKERLITAWKVDGPRGPEWRIHPSNPGSSQDTDASSVDNTQDTNVVHPGTTLLVQLFQDQAAKLEAKLEAATFRCGYLEAQNEEQTKLLPDLQAQAAELLATQARFEELESELKQLKNGWWYRLRCWFKPQKKVNNEQI